MFSLSSFCVLFPGAACVSGFCILDLYCLIAETHKNVQNYSHSQLRLVIYPMGIIIQPNVFIHQWNISLLPYPAMIFYPEYKRTAISR